jgi:hypothetical protein
MRRLTKVLLAAGLLAACGPAGSGSLGAAPTASARPLNSPRATASTPVPSPLGSASTARPSAGLAPPPPASTGTAGRTITFEIWLVRDGKLALTKRTRPATPATGRLALTTLIQGPTAAETAAGLTSPIDRATTFDIALANGAATVDLPASFYAGGRTPARTRQAQVVYTLTQYPTITKIGFQQDGAATGWPLGRADYADLLPPIVVASPVVGQRVTSPITVAGTASVFEATVSIRIRDARGVQLATTFTTATCGSGCRGAYSVPVRYGVTSAQAGTVEVFSVSPKDGSDQQLVRIPVKLTP